LPNSIDGENLQFMFAMDGNHASQDQIFIATKDRGFLLSWDNTHSKFGVEGERNLEWSSAGPPRTGCAHSPFLILSFPDRLDIYNAFSMQIVQTIPMKSISMLCPIYSLKKFEDSETSIQTPTVFIAAMPFNVNILKMKPVFHHLQKCVENKR